MEPQYYDSSNYFNQVMIDMLQDIERGRPVRVPDTDRQQHRALVRSQTERPTNQSLDYQPGDVIMWDLYQSLNNPNYGAQAPRGPVQWAHDMRDQYGPSYTIPQMGKDISNLFNGF